METEVLLVFLTVSILAGLLGGVLGAHAYQKNQRTCDKRRWEQLLSESSEAKVSIKKTDDGKPFISISSKLK